MSVWQPVVVQLGDVLGGDQHGQPGRPEERDVAQVQDQQRRLGDLRVEPGAHQRGRQRVDLADDVHDTRRVAVRDQVEADDLADLLGVACRQRGVDG